MDVNSTFEKTGIKCKVLQEIIQLAKKNCVEKVILLVQELEVILKSEAILIWHFAVVAVVILFWM